MSTAVTVPLDNRFARDLPELAVAWQAAAAPDPSLLVLDEALAVELGLDPSWLRSAEGVRFLSGDGVGGVAQAYSGHQFGGFSPRLGDGRALLLGELADADGRVRDLHLKGSGRTPFARGGDGLAAVGPMLREYVMSRAMHALGVPTTRSLAVVSTGGTVLREQPLPGAVLARVAASHLRVGSFQFAALTGDEGLLRRLADHAIARHHPDTAGDYLAFYERVVAAQAALVARWMLVGFIHGVMNTDNMTISGETIDYGPCAFLDAYDPATVFSSIDSAGRYAFGNQPAIAEWNLARLAETLLPLFHDEQEKAVEIAVEELGRFRERYVEAYTAGMRAKLGLPEGLDNSLIEDLLPQLKGVDYTSFFRSLTVRGADGIIVDVDADWLARWRALEPDPARMAAANPVYIPRNHLVEEALSAAVGGDLGPLSRLVEAVSAPFEERPGFERYAEPAPAEFGRGYQTFCGT